MKSTILMLTSLVALTACGQAPSALSQIVQAKAGSPAPQASGVAPQASPMPSAAASPFPLTYFAATAILAPQAEWPTKTYTAVGYCIIYLSKTYCWDDGMHKTTIPNFDGQYSYFNMNWDGRMYALANGGMESDFMTEPKIIAGGVAINIKPGIVNLVLTTGTAHEVLCSIEVSILDCKDFQIDLNQAVL